MKSRRKRTFTPAALGLLSLAQMIAGIVLLVVALTLDHHPETACPQPSFIIPPSEPGHAPYLDLSALFGQPTIACTQEQPLELFHEIITPFMAEANRRRAERAESDPAYAQRIDPALNRERINFLFFGYGETYEPPYGPNFKGSINVFSLDLRTLTLSTVTLNHDIRAPEVERYRQNTDHKPGPTKIDQAYPIGGFDVMRLAVEDATGLSVDFQLAMEDGAIKRAVDDVFGGLAVSVPYDFDALPVYFNGVQFPAHHYSQGTQKLDGLYAVQFIKALYQGTYDPNMELAVRKQIVVKAMLEATKREAINPIFWTKALNFLRGELERKAIVYDFDPTVLLLQSIQKTIAQRAIDTVTLPTVGASVYVVDERSGDGGVEWVTGSVNPIMQRDLANGVYTDHAFSVPKDGADPYAPDPVASYWPSVRALVKRKLDPASVNGILRLGAKVSDAAQRVTPTEAQK